MSPVFTPKHRQVFNHWNLESGYKRYRGDLIAVARIACNAVKHSYQSNPDKEDCVEAVTSGLLACEPFGAIMQGWPHLRMGMHGVLAEAMARYLLDHNWDDLW